ncbi:hypothetical protein ABT282_30990 [Streptomyces sp. NPDC000927]|uniref:hypothetical protein n=1 Tax=Streptomyces sp. NPDC000927 TaxID=3154371 RepID=UPI00332BF4EC
MITCIPSTAKQIVREGIWNAVTTPVTTVTMNVQILSTLRWGMKPDHTLYKALRHENVLVSESCEEGRYNGTITVDDHQLGALENELLTLRQERVDMGLPLARIRQGFDSYAMDAAMAEVQGARWELAEELAA